MALWTPAEITTDLWLDADDESTITVATGVSEWRDKSGNSRHVIQSTTSAQPLVVTAGLNSKNIIRFDGSNDLLSSNNGILANTAFSVFAVCKLRSSLIDKKWICGEWNSGGSPGTNEWLLSYGAGTNIPRISIESGSTTYAASATSALLNVWGIHSATHDLSNLRHFLNDVNDGTSSVTVTKNSVVGRKFIIGAIAAGFWTPLDICEIIILPYAANDEERKRLGGYLAWKWGLEASLAADHPYKDAAPTTSGEIELLDFTSTGGIVLGGTSIISYFVGPVGKFLLSNPPISGLFLGSRALFVSPTRDYEDGGIKQNDPSSGHLYQRWRCRIFGDYVVLDAEEVLPQVIFVGAELTECSIAFDQNMRPALAVVEAGQPKLQWYDTSVGAQVVTFLDPDVVTPRVTLDDKRSGQTANSDVILAYVRLGGLYYRQQSDRFLIEYLLDAGPHTGINKIGMNKHFRLQFSMMGVAP